MEPTLFRKVFCKDRLPDKGGEYHTDKGKDIFILISEEWDKYFVKASEWWLEPVQEITDEEIERRAKENGYNTEYINDLINKKHWKAGYKQALEYLKENNERYTETYRFTKHQRYWVCSWAAESALSEPVDFNKRKTPFNRFSRGNIRRWGRSIGNHVLFGKPYLHAGWLRWRLRIFRGWFCNRWFHWMRYRTDM